MNASDYQREAARTLISGPDFELMPHEFMTLWCAIGLGGEAGEVLEIVKKGLLHRHGLSADKLKKEIGDCLWYLAGLCTVSNIDMSEVMQINIDKLKERYPNGYSSGDSQRRVDTLK